MNISFTKISSVLAAGAALAFVNAAQALSFNYSSEPGAAITFAGNSTFSFTGTPGHIFQVTSGSANTLLGDLTGTYTIGAGTTTAPVTGAGQFIIHDGAFDFTATISWNDITQLNALGGLNVLTASVNMTGMTYGGTNPDLLNLTQNGTAINTVSFQFSTPHSLQDLRTQQLSNSFSGTVSSVPDSGTGVALLGLALAGLAFVRRKLLA